MTTYSNPPPGSTTRLGLGAYNAGNYHNGRGTFHVNEAFIQFGIPLLNLCQHVIEGIDEDADFIAGRLYCPDRIVLIFGNDSGRGGQLQDRPRNQTLEFRGKIECQKGDNHHHADRNSRILAKPRVHSFQV